MARLPWVLTREMFLTEQEVEKLREFLHARVKSASKAEYASVVVDQLIVTGLMFSGLRNSEFCRLRVKDTIVGGGESVFDVCGTRRQDRTVYIPDFVSNLVLQFVDDVRPIWDPDSLSPTDHTHPLVFNDRGRAYERTGLYRRVVRILSEAGFADRASVQLLRHTYGYLGYKRSGGNLLFLQRQLGHAHPMVTSVYAQFVDEDYMGIANRVGGMTGS